MGMYLSVASLSEATINRLHDDPPLVWQIIAPDDPEAVARARGAPKGPGLLSRLFGRGRAAPAEPAPAPTLVLAEGEGEMLELDKAWHGIHYLLTGTAWEGDPPLNFLLVGGREVGDEEIGYSVPRTLTPAESRDVAVALAALSDDQLRARFAPDDMMRLEIYPEIWDRNPAEDDTLGYLMAHVEQLRSALPGVVARWHGMLVTLT
jgi:hypothetical protein